MRTIISLALAGLIAACSTAPDTLEGTLDRAANHFNQNGLDIINEELKATGMNVSVEGEDTLVMRVEGIATGNLTFDPIAMTKVMRENICESDWNRRVFEKGGRLRIELVSNYGKELPPILFAKC
ncbi:MAG: hypothetical protein ABJP70_04645 [Erythrobacter sp.]